MPRELDRYRRLAQVTNNPNNTLNTGRNLANIIAQPGPNAEQILADGLEDAINNILTWIDDGTGLNLLGWAQDLESLLSEAGALSGDLLSSFLTWLQGIDASINTALAPIWAALQQSWMSFQNIINSVVGEVDSTVVDFIAALNATADNASSATGDWTTVFEDLGLPEATAAGFATYITDWTTAVNDILGAFASGGTSSEFVTGVTNLLNLLGLSNTTLGSATDLTTFWTGFVNDIIDPLDLLIAKAGTEWTALGTDLSNTWDSLFGSTSAPSNTAKVLQTAVSDLGDAWTALFGSSSNPTTGSQVLQTAVQDLDNAWTALFGSSSAPSSSAVLQYPALPAVTVGGSSDDIQSFFQNIADVVDQAVNGGSPSGATIDSILTNLQKFPQSNIAIDTAAGSSTVAYDATGAGATSATTMSSSGSISGNHTIGTGANYVVASVTYYTSSTIPQYIPVTVTCGGVAMEQLDSINMGIAGQGILALYALSSPPTGTQSIEWSFSDPGISVYTAALESTSYSGWGSTGTVVSASGIGTGLSSGAVSSASGQMVIQTFAVATSAGPTISSYNKTSRANSGAINNSTFGYEMALLIGDAAGASSVTFTATGGNVNDRWGSLAVAIGAPGSGVGSGLLCFNNSTSTVNGSSGTNTFPNDFFNQNVYLTEDMTYSTTGNTLTIGLAGWYKVRVNVLEAAVITAHFIRTVLYHNGSVVQVGTTMPVSTTASNTYVTGDAYSVYCVPGDTLQPGYWLSGSVSSVFVGETTGAFSYWSASLMNRSLL